MEHRIGLRVRNKPLLTFFPGTIRLNPAVMDFKDYLNIKSGIVTVHYPLSALFQNHFPLSIHAENLLVEPGPDLKKTLGQNTVLFDRISAKLSIQRNQTVSFEFLDAESKTIQFHLGMKA